MGIILIITWLKFKTTWSKYKFIINSKYYFTIYFRFTISVHEAIELLAFLQNC